MIMKFSEYLKAHLLHIVLLILTLTITAFSLSLFRIDPFSIFFLILVPSAILLTGFLVTYSIKSRYYNQLIKTLEHLDQKSLIPELISWPSFLEGQILYRILKTVGKDMNDQIGLYRRNAQDYREFVESWVHEIKTPIASMKLMIENHPEITNLGIGEDLEQIEDYITQALFYARSGSVEKDYMIRPLSLDTAVNPIIRKNARTFIRKKISLKTEGLDLTVYSDPKWLEFILSQLLTNALKYLDSQKDTPPTILIEAHQDHSEVTLSIQDNGIGIPQNELPRVFDKGFTGSNGRRQNTRSTGLGLYLCKKLCDRLGLGIRLFSEPSIGTTVQVIFPTFSKNEW